MVTWGDVGLIFGIVGIGLMIRMIRTLRKVLRSKIEKEGKSDI